MLDKLRIIYPYVKDEGNGCYVVGGDGKYGLMQNGRVVIPAQYHTIRFMEQFIVAGVSRGFGYTAVFDYRARRVLPAPESGQELVEVHSVKAWVGVGLVLLIKESPTYRNPIQLVFLGNNGVIKRYPGVVRLPLKVEGTGLRAVAAPDTALKAPGFTISREQCLRELEAGNILEVLDESLEACSVAP